MKYLTKQIKIVLWIYFQQKVKILTKLKTPYLGVFNVLQ